MGKRISFREFLRIERLWDFQTKKIAGSPDYGMAIDILKEKFWLVGVVEQFDEFLLVLKKKLEPVHFDPRYQRQNIGKGAYREFVAQVLEQYSDEIRQRNREDIELYKFVKDELFAKEKADYGRELLQDINAFRESNSGYKWGVGRYLDYLYRKLYIDPITGLIRMKNGLPYKGSY